MRPRLDSPLALATREVVNRHDPAGLLALHCPADEYDPELPDVLAAMLDSASPGELRERLVRVFMRFFDAQTAAQFGAWDILAGELWSLTHPDG